MKKIIFLLISILFSLDTFAQRIALNKAVGVDLPKNLHEITKEQAQAHAGEKFKGNKLLLNFADVTTDNGRLFKIDGIIVELKSFDTTFNFKDGHALSFKKGLDEMGKGDPTYKSSIENINNNTILVTNSVSDNTCYCFFYCFNARNTTTINGRLVYDRSDSAKAETVLTDLLNGIKFKD